MTDRPNIFDNENVTNVTQLFDALWFNATNVIHQAVADLGQDLPEEHVAGFIRQAREIAITDAHNRYQDLIKASQPVQ